MFLKIVHFEEGEYEFSSSYALYEGDLVHVIWQNKKENTPLRFYIEGYLAEANPGEITIGGDNKRIIYIMSNDGKTIERITYDPTRKARNQS